MLPFVIDTRLTNINTNSFKLYLNEVSKIPLLTDKEEFEYALRAKKGDEKAKNILIKSNLRFVISVAKQSCDENNSLEDLINEGNEGLIKAIEKYDPTKGFKFISYAVWWIRQKINEYKNENGKTVRLPLNKLSLVNRYKISLNKLHNLLDREPTDEEIIKDMSITHEMLSEIKLIYGGHTDYLDSHIDKEGCPLIDKIHSVNDRTDQNTITSDNLFTFNELLSTLNKKDEELIRLCFGLGEHKPLTLEETGDIIGMSREAVRLRRDKALLKLKSKMIKYNIVFDDVFNNHI